MRHLQRLLAGGKLLPGADRDAPVGPLGTSMTRTVGRSGAGAGCYVSVVRSRSSDRGCRTRLSEVGLYEFPRQLDHRGHIAEVDLLPPGMRC